MLDYLLNDIMVKHRNHTTSGIVGVRAMLEALPKLGRADVALSILLRTDYPSFGAGSGPPCLVVSMLTV